MKLTPIAVLLIAAMFMALPPAASAQRFSRYRDSSMSTLYRDRNDRLLEFKDTMLALADSIDATKLS